MNLVINTFGATLQVHNGIFLVSSAEGRKEITPNKLRSISLSRGASITSDAALLAVEHEIDVLFVNGVGQPVGRLWSIRYGSISTIRRRQLDFVRRTEAVTWVKDVVIQKLDNQVALLLAHQPDHEPHTTMFGQAINKIEDYKRKVRTLEAVLLSDVSPTLRGWEGAASKAYFDALALLMPTGYEFAQRSQHPAVDVFNCLLNYGYGMLYGKVEGALIRAGIDPYVGVLHRDDYNRPSLAYDVIELYRVWADHVVVQLCRQQAIDAECYSVRPDGSYWLESMGKRILIQSVNDYLDEIITLNALQRARATHIELMAQRLAQQFLNLPDND